MAGIHHRSQKDNWSYLFNITLMFLRNLVVVITPHCYFAQYVIGLPRHCSY